MNTSGTVLVGVSNPKTAVQLVQIGIELARARSARLVVVSIVVVPTHEPLSAGAREARAQRRVLRRAVSAAEEAGVTVESIARAGYTVDEALVDVAAEINATLMVVGWGSSTKTGLVTDSAMWRLSQEPPCDVLAVKAANMSPSPKRILLPVRGGQHAELAASLATGLARQWGARVTVLRIIPAFVSEADASSEATAFKTYWESAYPGIVDACSVVAPRIQDYLIAEAANHDLLIMGAAASTRSFPYPYGQMAEEIAQRVTCPVFVAKTERQLTIEEFGTTFQSSGSPSGREEESSTVVDKWFAGNTFHSKEFAQISELVRLKEQQGLKISLVLPTLNEEETIGPIITCMQEYLQVRHPLLDEMLVIDSRSQDRTAAIARSLGIPVYVHQDILPQVGSYSGKGEALWKSLAVVSGDIIAWIDTDIANIHPKFVYGLLGPLLREPRLAYVKGFYQRPLRQDGVLHESSGGRVTELTARPLLNLFYPLLSGLIQPLSGEYAGRRDVLMNVQFCTGYGVEIALLIDILEQFGLQSIAQVDLEQRIHRNQSLAALSRMSFTILQTVINRLEAQRQIELVSAVNRSMKAIVHTREHFHLDVRRIEEFERPPMAEMLLTGVLA